jgi:methylglutaconyl-CoA hydratase
MSDLVLIQREEAGIAHVRLNRPGKRNALNIPLLESLAENIERLNADESIRAIVLGGEGPTFCAGLDLAEAQDNSRAHTSAELIARTIRALYHSPKVTLCRVQGGAIAGGCGLMSACDFAYAEVTAKLGYPEVRRGLVAGLVMTLLVRQIAERHARELLLTGEIIDAERAEAIGLINQAVPSDCLDERIGLVLDQILLGAPGAIRITKRFLEDLRSSHLDADLDLALDLHVEVRSSGEAQEGFRAFTEKRPPAWQQ